MKKYHNQLSQEDYYKLMAEANGWPIEGEKMEEERLTSKEIIDLSKLVGKELGSLFSGTLEYVFQNNKINIRASGGLGPFGRVHIEYLYRGEWTPVFDYEGPLMQVTRFRYGKWVDILEELGDKAERRIEERENEFFGDLDEDTDDESDLEPLS